MHLSILIITLCLFSIGNCIKWHMHPNSYKCLREEIRANVVVVGVYEVVPVDGQQINYVVTDSNNHILSQKEDISSGKFTFSIENNDLFEICFTSKVLNNHKKGVVQEIFLDIKTGIETKNYEVAAELNQLKPLELRLKIIEDLSKDIIQEFTYMKNQADAMHNTNESTNKRVLYFGVFSMICLFLLATWQVFYLRRYFKAKKLIE